AAGLPGMPWPGQRASAAVKASCIASSARSKEPETRMRPAMMRPDSRRNTDSTVLFRSSIYIRRRAVLPSFALSRHRPDGPYFNTTGAAGASGGDLRGPFERFVQVLAIENVVSGKLLLGLRERPVGYERLAILHANGRGAAGRLQRFSASEDSANVGLFHDGPVLGRDSLLFLRRGDFHRAFV